MVWSNLFTVKTQFCCDFAKTTEFCHFDVNSSYNPQFYHTLGSTMVLVPIGAHSLISRISYVIWYVFECGRKLWEYLEEIHTNRF